MTLALKDGAPAEPTPSRVEILARLSLGDDTNHPELGGNLVVLLFTLEERGFTISNIAPIDKTLTFALDARQDDKRAKKASRRVTGQAVPSIRGVAAGAPHLTISISSLSLPLCGQVIELHDGVAWARGEIAWMRSKDEPPQPGGGRVSLQRLT